MKKLVTILVILTITIFAFGSNVYADYYSDYITLRYGMRSNDVKRLQDDLKSLGYFNNNSTGYFGSLTNQSVIKYQKDNGLSVDGIVGHQTAKEIKVDKVIKLAKSYQGVPYTWGGTSPSGFDCSGFTHYVFLQNGITIPRTSAAQYNSGTWVHKSQLKPGDLVFFTTYKAGASHVGIYIGNNKFIHASSGAGKIVVSDMDNTYYKSHYVGAKRVIY